MLIKLGRLQIKVPPLANFTRIPLTIRLRNIPVFLAFNIIPLIAAICEIFGFRQPEYEYLWGATLMLLLFSQRSYFQKWAYDVIRIILLLIFLKYILPLCWTRNVSLKALMIDFKWIYYLIWAILWINFAGKIDLSVLYRCGRNMALGYCIYVILQTIRLGGYSRAATYLFDECNYVCYLILIPYCFIRQMKGSLLDQIIFLLAVFLSDSRTGLASAVVITAYPHYMESRHKARYWIGAMIFVVAYIKILFIGRGHNDFESVDRVMFATQYLYCLSGFNIFDVFFGLYPGSSIPLPQMADGFSWHIRVFESMHGISGCYPFYFHSTYLRLLFVWGIPIVIWLIYRIIRLFQSSGNLSARRLIILFSLESVSLSTLSLTNVSVIFFLTVITLYLKKIHSAFNLCLPRSQGHH